MADKMGIGLIGCGNSSKAYFQHVPSFLGMEILSCADLNRNAAERRGTEFGVPVETVRDLLRNDNLDLIINLTVPDAHSMVSHEIVSHGKHVYSEKPLVTNMPEGASLLETGRRHRRAIGCAPDTFLGAAAQAARQAIDEGLIGDVVGGTCHVMNKGVEAWHPNPDFLYRPGGGPVLDLGPYYITSLVNLIGPAKRVAAMSGTMSKSRTIGSGPRKGETVEVTTPTTVHATIEFENSALVTFSASWDVVAHRHSPIEIYGTKGTLYLPDPVYFDGDVIWVDGSGKARFFQHDDHPFRKPNTLINGKLRADYRTAGLADMILALQSGQNTFRCSAARAFHCAEVLVAILRSGEDGKSYGIRSSATRPEPLSAQQASAMMC